MEIIIKVEEDGRITLNVAETIPDLLAIGMLEVAKNLIITQSDKKKIEQE